MDEVHDGFENFHVSGTAADVAAQIVAHGFFRRVVISRKHRLDGQDHSGGAEPALQRAMGDERTLHGVELPALRQPFDRGDFALVRVRAQGGAARGGIAVEQDGTSAADLHVAGSFGALQVKAVAQYVYQHFARLDFDARVRAIELEVYAHQWNFLVDVAHDMHALIARPASTETRWRL